MLLCLLALVPAGCARHADFVDMRDELRSVAKAQEQERKRQEALQARLKTLEDTLAEQNSRSAKDSPAKRAEAMRQRLEELSDRLKALEGRMARSQEPRPALPVPPEADFSEPSRQSKPARLPEPPPVLPGTPDISPTSAFNLAYNDYLDGRYELAVQGFQRFLQDFSSTSLASSAHYWMGESYYSMKDYPQAVQAFEQVVKDYPRSEKVPPALFKLGLLSVESGDVLKARGFFKRVIEEFSSSNEAKLARNKLAELR